MSNVGGPDAPGTTLRSAHVVPPSVETKMGASDPPSGGGVKAVATSSLVFAGLTARFGSLSWFVSPLNDCGMMLTTLTVPTSAVLVQDGGKRRDGLTVISVQELVVGELRQLTLGAMENPEALL